MRRPSCSLPTSVLILSLILILLCFFYFKSSFLFQEFKERNLRIGPSKPEIFQRRVGISFLFAVFIRNCHYPLEYHKVHRSSRLCTSMTSSPVVMQVIPPLLNLLVGSGNSSQLLVFVFLIIHIRSETS